MAKAKSKFDGAVSELDRTIAKVICAIPQGQVMSYGSVAALAGKWGGARRVARALRTLTRVPWWRVIRSDGTLAKEVATRQTVLLRKEGVTVKGRRVLQDQPTAKAGRR